MKCSSARSIFQKKESSQQTANYWYCHNEELMESEKVGVSQRIFSSDSSRVITNFPDI